MEVTEIVEVPLRRTLITPHGFVDTVVREYVELPAGWSPCDVKAIFAEDPRLRSQTGPDGKKFAFWSIVETRIRAVSETYVLSRVDNYAVSDCL